jgi:hypothetical protein
MASNQEKPIGDIFLIVTPRVGAGQIFEWI